MIETIGTIFTYAIVYSLAILLVSSADKTISIHRKKWKVSFAVIFLAFFSSLRDIEVGTDTVNTIVQYFDSAVKYNSIYTLFSSELSGSTIVFFLIAKFIMAIGLGYKTFLFCMTLLILIPVAVVAYMRRENTPMAATMMFFLFLYFQLSFNWIRQSIAASFLILSVVLFIGDKKKSSIIIALISILFHSSALLGLMLFIVAWFSSKSKSKLVRGFLVFITVLFAILIMTSWKMIALFMINQGILPASYIGYVNVFSGMHGSSFQGWFNVGLRTYGEYILRVGIFIVPFISVRHSHYNMRLANEENKGQEFALFKMCGFLSILIYSAGLFGLHTAYINRVTYFLDFSNIVYLGFTCNINKKHSKFVVPFSQVATFVIAFVYNIWLYYILGWHETVPFSFSF